MAKLTKEVLDALIQEALVNEALAPETAFKSAIDSNDPQIISGFGDSIPKEKAEKFAEIYFQEKISSQLDDNNLSNIDFDEVVKAVNDAYGFISKAFGKRPDAEKIARKKIAVLLNDKFSETYGLSLNKWVHSGDKSGSKRYLAQILSSIEDVADNDGEESNLTYDDATKGLLGSEAGYKELQDFLNLFQNKELKSRDAVVTTFVKDIAAFANNFLNSSISSYAEIPDDPDLDGFGKETNFALQGGKFDTLFNKSKDLDDVLEKFIDRIVDDAAGNDLTAAELDGIKGLTEDADALELSDFVKAFNDADSLYQAALSRGNQTVADTARNDMAKYGRAIKKAKRIIDREIPQEFSILKKALQNKLKSIEDEKTAADTPFSGVSDSENYKNPQYMGSVKQTKFVGPSFGFTDMLMSAGTGSAQRGQIYEEVDLLMRNSFPAENISIKDKFTLLNNTSDAIINNKSNDVGSIGEKLGRSTIVNSMSDAINKLDANSAGFVMEHLLAQLTVGTQVGGDRGLADLQVYSAAGMGPAAAEQSIGSAKAYAKPAPISQANTNWAYIMETQPNKEISYFFISKSKLGEGKVDIYFIGLKDFKVSGSTGSPKKIGDAEIITGNLSSGGTKLFAVKPDGKDFTLTSGTNFTCYNIDGKTINGINLKTSGQLGPTNKNAANNGLGKNLGTIKGAQLKLEWETKPTDFLVGTLNVGTADQIAQNSETYVQTNINTDISKMLKLINDLKKNIDKYMLGNDFEAGTDAMQNYIDLEDAIVEGFEEKGKESGRQIGMKKGVTGDAGAEQGVRYVQTDQGTFKVDATGKRVKLTDDELAAIRENKFAQIDLMIENMVKQFIKGNLND